LLQSLTLFEGNILQIFTRPFSGTLMVASIVIITLSIIAGVKKKKEALVDVEV
jgi:putative tricarboxylic transport membrane protein